MKKVFLATLVGLCLSGCKALDMYQGVFKTDTGIELKIESDSMQLTGLSQLGLKDQSLKTESVFQNFDDVFENLSNAKTGIYSFPSREAVQGHLFQQLFGVRQPKVIEKNSKIELSDSIFEVYVVTQIEMSEQTTFPQYYSLKGGSSTMLALHADKNTNKQVDEFDAVLGVDIDTSAEKMLNVQGGEKYSQTISMNPAKQYKLHFKRVSN
jgi:hypothetical protein